MSPVTDKGTRDGGALAVVVEASGTKTVPSDAPENPAVGRWYWLRDDDEHEGEKVKEWLGCITHIGSNYVLLRGVRDQTLRVHFNEFWESCRFESDAARVISGEIAQRQENVQRLMKRVVEITSRLAISPGTLTLPANNETRALATLGGRSIDDYKTALVEAKEKTLPELFKQIKNENIRLAHWMKAQIIPLRAQAETLEPAIEAIENRLFSVELYAGLVETVEQIRDGAPAAMGEKIRLFQRRHYMDEECLAQYETGGMNFKNIRDFDRWLTRPSNFERLLPFPRCVVAFRVRRHSKEQFFSSIAEFMRMMRDKDYDKQTFLYIRNGEQLYRLDTSIEFGENLFPDLDCQLLQTGKVWAKVGFGRDDDENSIISDNEYQGMKETFERERVEYRAWKKLPKKEQEKNYKFEPRSDLDDYTLFNPDTVYYDDIAERLAKRARKHNRLVLVLQGLLDRSPAWHPHPPWSLWSDGGFAQALELLYDKSHALTPGDQPDFQAYRERLNASLKTGDITVGQEIAWERIEYEKDVAKRGRDRFGSGRLRPYGNPGPGTLAHVVGVSRDKKKVTYQWTRERLTRSDDYDNVTKEVACRLTLNSKAVFNVSAYKPGDFKQFFNDPRTRASYLKWAPLLLAAEEFHAGNREVAPVKPLPPRRKTAYGSAEYTQRKENKAKIGKAVRLVRNVEMRNGTVYKKGSLWRVRYWGRGGFTIDGILPDGKPDPADDNRSIRKLGAYSFEPALGIPDAPKPEPEPAPKKRDEDEDEDPDDDE